jgi:hypothetical protein
LLSVGSQATPKKDLIGEVGTKELSVVKAEGKEGGLARYFEKGGKSVTLDALGKNGLPPLPSGASFHVGGGKYNLTEENAYPEQ